MRMHFMRGVYCLLTLVDFYPLRAVAAESPSVTRDQQVHHLDLRAALAFAAEKSPLFRTIQYEKTISDMEEKSARARMLPSLDLNTTHGILDSRPTSGANRWQSEFDLSLTESLYDNGASWTNWQIAKLSQKRADVLYRHQQNKMAFELATKFLTFSIKKKLFQIQEMQAKRIGKYYDLVSRDFHQGLRTKKDYLRFKTLLSRTEMNVVVAKREIETAQLALEEALGGAVANEMVFDFTPLPLDAFHRELPAESTQLNAHLLYQAAQYEKEANDLTVSLQNRKNLPEIFLSAGVNYTSANYIGSGQTFSDNAKLGWNALLTLKYNFFDWGIRSRDADIAKYKMAILNNTVDSRLLDLKSTLSQIHFDIERTKKNFSLAQDLLALEQDNIAFLEKEYRNGKLQYLDLINGLSDFANAEESFYTAVADLQKLHFEILFHQGRLYEELLN